MQNAFLWIVPALFILSIALWRVARERARIKASWTLLIVGAATWTVSLAFSAWFPNSGMIHNVAEALVELATAQICAVLILDVILRRVHVPKFVSEALLVGSYLAVVFDLLYKVGVNVSGIFATSAVAAAAVGLALQDMLGNIAGGVTPGTRTQYPGGAISSPPANMKAGCSTSACAIPPSPHGKTTP